MKRFWRIFWIVYAWLFLVIGISGIISDFIYGRVVPAKDMFFSIIYIPAIFAILGYAHRWRVWKSGVYFWRAYLFIYIASSIAQLWLNNWLPSQIAYRDLFITLVGVVIPLILVIFSVIGVYLYAFRFLRIKNELLINPER